MARRIRPLPEELRPLPEGVVSVPLPERVAVDIPADGPEAQQAPLIAEIEPTATCGSYMETDIRPLRQQ